ncbi:hypothetical protein HDU76_012925 [Blyttiomyces sp. JEL0837]|nr:hypothetical protein HDU76_012925 [Blyttiomyces sp. JEL0837]
MEAINIQKQHILDKLNAQHPTSLPLPDWLDQDDRNNNNIPEYYTPNRGDRVNNMPTTSFPTYFDQQQQQQQYNLNGYNRKPIHLPPPPPSAVYQPLYMAASSHYYQPGLGPSGMGGNPNFRTPYNSKYDWQGSRVGMMPPPPLPVPIPLPQHLRYPPPPQNGMYPSPDLRYAPDWDYYNMYSNNRDPYQRGGLARSRGAGGGGNSLSMPELAADRGGGFGSRGARSRPDPYSYDRRGSGGGYGYNQGGGDPYDSYRYQQQQQYQNNHHQRTSNSDRYQTLDALLSRPATQRIHSYPMLSRGDGGLDPGGGGLGGLPRTAGAGTSGLGRLQTSHLTTRPSTRHENVEYNYNDGRSMRERERQREKETAAALFGDAGSRALTAAEALGKPAGGGSSLKFREGLLSRGGGGGGVLDGEFSLLDGDRLRTRGGLFTRGGDRDRDKDRDGGNTISGLESRARPNKNSDDSDGRRDRIDRRQGCERRQMEQESPRKPYQDALNRRLNQLEAEKRRGRRAVSSDDDDDSRARSLSSSGSTTDGSARRSRWNQDRKLAASKALSKSNDRMNGGRNNVGNGGGQRREDKDNNDDFDSGKPSIRQRPQQPSPPTRPLKQKPEQNSEVTKSFDDMPLPTSKRNQDKPPIDPYDNPNPFNHDTTSSPPPPTTLKPKKPAKNPTKSSSSKLDTGSSSTLSGSGTLKGSTNSFDDTPIKPSSSQPILNDDERPLKSNPTLFKSIAQSTKSPIEVAPPTKVKLADCNYCGRHFAEDRLGKHEDVCQDNPENASRRRQFDPKAMRVKGTELDNLGKGALAMKEKEEARLEEIRKKTKEAWRSKHAAKALQKHLASGGKASDLPPPPPAPVTGVQCQSCLRFFNESSIERHSEICQRLKQKGRPMKMNPRAVGNGKAGR